MTKKKRCQGKVTDVASDLSKVETIQWSITDAWKKPTSTRYNNDNHRFAIIIWLIKNGDNLGLGMWF